MPRFPPISDYQNKIGADGRPLCRNCPQQVPLRRRHYCSTFCMNTFVYNHHWKFVRKDILRRDRYVCSICNKKHSTALLQIDHIIPVRAGIDPYDKENLRTLCKDCHRAKTALERSYF